MNLAPGFQELDREMRLGIITESDIFNLVHLFSYAPHPGSLKGSSLICSLFGSAFLKKQSPPGRGLAV